MATPTYDLLDSTTLASSASSVTFSSISQDYRDLIVAINASANAGGVLITFNNDTGANYSRVTMGGNGSTTGSISNTGSNEVNIVRYASFSGGLANAIVQVMDYSATDKHKTVLSRTNRASNGVDTIAARWANTSAINEIDIASVGSFDAGSTFYLYGIAS